MTAIATIRLAPGRLPKASKEGTRGLECVSCAHTMGIWQVWSAPLGQREDIWIELIKSGKHPTIDVAEGYPLPRFTPQYIELVPKDKDFGLQGARDQNSRTTAHQINLQRSPISASIKRFAGDRQPVLDLR